MTRLSFPVAAFGAFFLFLFAGVAAEPSAWEIGEQLVFADRVAIVKKEGAEGPVSVEVDRLTPGGWEKPETRVLEFRGGGAELRPLGEGIHRVRAEGGGEVRFLAIAPPDRIGEGGGKAVPGLVAKLRAGKEVTILAMGDSVTATGEYPRMLGRMLQRAAGIPAVRIVRKAYPGRSVDASVRRWKGDMEGLRPDLALIMYGLNDQGANVPLAAYLEQYAWLARHLREESGAEVVFLEPTPHINIATPDAAGKLPPEASIFRTIVYAAALRDLGRRLGVPVVPTFDALWGQGAEGLPQQARRLWPLFPPHYRKTFESLVETDGKGDTIHPNALGHLQMARAVFRTLLEEPVPEPLSFTAFTRWKGTGAESVVRVTNRSAERREGRLSVYPFPQDDTAFPLEYALEAGASAELRFGWPHLSEPGDLLEPPLRRVFRAPGPYVQVLVREGAGSRVSAVAAPWQPEVGFVPERQIARGPELELPIKVGHERRTRRLRLPADGEVGREALVEAVRTAEGEAFAVAEVSWVRFAAAREGEPAPDGDLADWPTATWVPVGEPVQARGTGGPRDHRDSPRDCFLHWSFAAGKEGLFAAFRGTGDEKNDSFTLFFDPRPPELLGSAGPYFWVEGKFREDGTLALKAGDSSPAAKGLEGKWKRSAGEIAGEIFIPYSLLDRSAWPESGDLGASIIWRHAPSKEKITTLMWAEDGHPWNTRWYGVIRRNPTGPLPYRVRVE